jgi:uncharacterized protein YggU (UPF0235/DUF167 family)
MFIKVKVHTESKENKIVKKTSDSYDVYVREKAERGEANKKVIETLSIFFKVPAGRIKLVKGGKKPGKIFEIP